MKFVRDEMLFLRNLTIKHISDSLALIIPDFFLSKI